MKAVYILILDILVLIGILIYAYDVYAYQIIYESEFENKTHQFCKMVTNNETEELFCLDYMLLVVKEAQTNISIQNRTINHSYTTNQTIEYHYNVTVVKNYTTVIDKSLELTEAEMKHKENMALIQKGIDPDKQEVDLSNYFTKSEVEVMISERLNVINPPAEIGRNSSFPFSVVEVIGGIILLGIGGFMLYKKFKPPKVDSYVQTEDIGSAIARAEKNAMQNQKGRIPDNQGVSGENRPVVEGEEFSKPRQQQDTSTLQK